MALTPEQEQAWMEQWRSAGVALAEQRRIELRSLSTGAALSATEALLSLADPRNIPERRRSGSGLVEQQALLHRSRR